MISKLLFYLKNQLRIGFFVSGIIILSSSSIAAAIVYPGSQQPGQGVARIQGVGGKLQNDLLSLAFDFRDGHLKPNSLTDKVSNSKRT